MKIDENVMCLKVKLIHPTTYVCLYILKYILKTTSPRNNFVVCSQTVYKRRR